MKKFFVLLMCVLTLTIMPIKAEAHVKRVSKTEWVEDTTRSNKSQPDKKVGTYTKKNGKKYSVYQGKRGGFYWIDENGKKHYIPKKK